MNDWDEGNFKFIAVIFVGVLLYLLGYFFFVTPAHSQSLDTQSSIDSAQAATNYINNNYTNENNNGQWTIGYANFK